MEEMVIALGAHPALRRQAFMSGVLAAAGLALAGMLLAGCGFPEPGTPLTAAAMRGDAAAVRVLLAHGADPNGMDDHGLTPLMLASRLGRIEVMKLLLAGGANPDLRDGPRTRAGWTPMMNAVHKGQLDAVRVLIEAKADVNLPSPDGATPLMLAAPEPSSEVVRVLLEAGADPRAGSDGSIALTNAVAGGRTENVKLLLARAPNLKLQRGFKGTAARMLARIQGHGDILDLLEASGALDPGAGRTSSPRAAPGALGA